MSKPLEEILPLSQFQSTVEIHWGLIIAGESVGSAVCFKNPWCQSLIFLGETLISCIVPGNHGLFSGQQKNPAHNAVPPFLHPHLCWMQHAGLWHDSSLCSTNTQISNITHGASVHRCITCPWNWSSFPSAATLFVFFLSFIFSIRRWVSVMKGSVLIQDEKIMCWPPEDYKTMLLLMS